MSWRCIEIIADNASAAREAAESYGHVVLGVQPSSKWIVRVEDKPEPRS